jgi:hypothetical protein
MAVKKVSVSKVCYCRDCKFGKAVENYMYRCLINGTLNHSPLCNKFKEK